MVTDWFCAQHQQPTNTSSKTATPISAEQLKRHTDVFLEGCGAVGYGSPDTTQERTSNPQKAPSPEKLVQSGLDFFGIK